MTEVGTERAAPRRSHAERRAETRARLVAATIESLVEEGWAGTTARGIARRAGVSQGAQQYHFRSKHELVAAALRSIVADQRLALVGHEPPATERELAGFVLDRLWEVHCLPVNLAVQELLTAARTDPETGVLMAQLTEEAEAMGVAVVVAMFGEAAAPGLEEWIRTCVATMRGIVAVAFDGDLAGAGRWPAAREVLLRGRPTR